MLLFFNNMFYNYGYIYINNHKYIDFVYEFYNKKYIYRLKINDDPIIYRNINVYNEDNMDVTESILSYMGPNYDFYNNNYCPKDFGYTTLFFYEDRELLKVFGENDILHI